MKILVAGVFNADGVNMISSVQELERIADEHREARSLLQRVQEDNPAWKKSAEVFLTRGYHDIGGASGANFAKAAWKKFYDWLADGANPNSLNPPRVLEFEEPEEQVANLDEREMLARVNQEFLDNTLLVKTEVTWSSVFDNSDQAPLRQKLASASLLVARRGQTTLYTKNVGALYSGLVATVYASAPSDMQSSAYSIGKWMEIGENRKQHRTLPFAAINKILLEEAKKGGFNAHNEVLAVLRPKALLGLFYQGPQRKKDKQNPNSRPAPSGEELKMYADLRQVQQQYQAVKKVPIFRFDYETTKFHLPDPDGAGLAVHAKASRA